MLQRFSVCNFCKCLFGVQRRSRCCEIHKTSKELEFQQEVSQRGREGEVRGLRFLHRTCVQATVDQTLSA